MSKELEKLANQFYEEGNWFEAEKLYMRILASDNQNTLAMYRLAFINVGKLDYGMAEMLLDAALRIKPEFETIELLAYVKEKMFKLYDAIIMYEKLIELEPSESLYEKVCNLYVSLELYDNAINITKDYIEKFHTIIAYRRLFLLYLNLYKKTELTNLITEIKEEFPNKGLMFNLVGMYKEFIEKDYSEAQILYEKAVKMGVSTASFDLALCLKKTGEYDKAEKYCKKILSTYPKKNDVLNLLKQIELVQKKTRKGYKYYIERTLNKDLDGLKNKWNGKEFKDKTILVVSDIRGGEFIINLRYITELKNKFQKVILACNPDTESLIHFPDIRVINNNDIFKTDFDYHVLLSELPYYLNKSFENILPVKPYISTEKIELNDDNYKVGLLWKASGDSFKSLHQESIDIAKIMPQLFEIDNVSYYSFQSNDIFNTILQFPQIKNISNEIHNLEDCAKYLNSMDLIISIDSELLHLAGAMNKQAIALIPFDSAWYWFNNDKKTEWYSSVEIAKQKNNDDWNEVANHVVERVKEYNAKHQKVK